MIQYLYTFFVFLLVFFQQASAQYCTPTISQQNGLYISYISFNTNTIENGQQFNTGNNGYTFILIKETKWDL